MLLKVVCQLCGKVTTIDVDKPIGSFSRWEYYKLGDFFDRDIMDPYQNYEIWICDECHRRVSTFTGLCRDRETGEYEEDWEIDYEKLTELLRESLRLEEV